jgi:hypothetical protein
LFELAAEALLTLEEALALLVAIFWAGALESEESEESESESLSEEDSTFLAFFLVSALSSLDADLDCFLSASFFDLFLVSSTLYFLEGASDEEALTFFVTFYNITRLDKHSKMILSKFNKILS